MSSREHASTLVYQVLASLTSFYIRICIWMWISSGMARDSVGLPQAKQVTGTDMMKVTWNMEQNRRFQVLLFLGPGSLYLAWRQPKDQENSAGLPRDPRVSQGAQHRSPLHTQVTQYLSPVLSIVTFSSVMLWTLSIVASWIWQVETPPPPPRPWSPPPSSATARRGPGPWGLMSWGWYCQAQGPLSRPG